MPGDAAHFFMEPPERRQFQDIEKIKALNPREAAVLALIYPKNNLPYLVMILRKTYKGVHSNQVAFPGGKVEKDDVDLYHTALRETEEEVGVPQTEVKLVKELSKVYIPPSNFWVQPFLALWEIPKSFYKQEDEVEAILEVPLHEVLNDDNLKQQQLSTSYAKNIQVPAFSLNNHIVWGLQL